VDISAALRRWLLTTSSAVVTFSACGTPSIASPSPAVAPGTPSPTSIVSSPTLSNGFATEAPPSVQVVDPDAGYEIWIQYVGDSFSLVAEDVTEMFEQTFYWIKQIDQTSYDPLANRVTIDVTIGYEEVFLEHLSEWQADTWDLYYLWSVDVVGALIDTFEAEPDLGPAADWPNWTPDLDLIANGGRLEISCPGDMIYRFSTHEATIRDFYTDCTFR
jgi:hypothetical protein